MKLLPVSKFLTLQAAPAPTGKYRAVAIHPSSEVDLVRVNGQLLRVGTIVPLDHVSAIESVRLSNGFGSRGEYLALALYEDCDALVPLGPRAPVFEQFIGDAAGLPGPAAAYSIPIRLPFQGRKMARITFGRSDTTKDMQLIVVGKTAGYRGQANNYSGASQSSVSSSNTWFSGGVAPTDPAGTAGYLRTIYVGGEGDNVEAFEELDICVRGDAKGGGAETYFVSAEAWGER